MSLRNIALLIEYDGTAYGGWQIQKNSTSIQGVLENALSRLLTEKVKIVGAGRTDAGVHAYGQVANFHTKCVWDTGKLVRALNGTLPRDIAVHAAADVDADFHSRFNAIGRKYLYRVISRKMPTLRKYAALIPYQLSVEKMNEAADLLVGEKSFKSFTKYADQQRSFICRVTKAKWVKETRDSPKDPFRGRQETGDRLPSDRFFLPPSSCFLFEIEANRFLHGMVRAIVGTLVDVGRGRITASDFRKILRSEKRALASMSAPACGLFLEEVKYATDIWENNSKDNCDSLLK